MNKNLMFAALTAMVSCVSSPQQEKNLAIDPANLDTSISPKSDFYQYATGGWQAKNPLKPEYARYGSFDVLRENNEIRLNDLFADMAKTKAAAGTVEQKIADLYRMGLDSVRLNNEGLAPIKADIDRIMKATTREELTAIVAKMHLSVSNPFFSAGVGADLKDSNVNAYYISQGGLGMDDRDYYLDEENAGIKTAYKAFLNKAFTLAGINAPAEGAEAVIRIEDAMAKVSRSQVELRDTEANYNPIARKTFVSEYKNLFDWEAYFTAMGVAKTETVILGQPETIKATMELFAKSPIKDLQYYLASQYISAAASYLSDDIYAASFDFFGKALSGALEQRPRWKRAMSVPNSVLSEAVGEMYVAKYFSVKDKERMTTLVKNLQTALAQHIDALTWMSDKTKAKAHEKLESFVVKIGYPDKWKDYTSLAIDPAKSYWENKLSVSEWYTRDNLADLGKPVDRDEWHMSPQTVNAYYNPTTNEICFPAAILQPPFYNSEADDVVNYGAIGVVIGHEMTHGFDDQGRNFDAAGNMNNWWQAEDAEKFKSLADILVAQFDALEVLPGVKANGSLTLGENIADQGGLRVAYTAYHNTLKGATAPAPIEGFTTDQRFYLAYATLWGQNIRDEEVARLTKLDVHSLGMWRVNASLRNIDTFFKAFDIKEGDAMWLNEDKRVIIW